MTMTMMPYHHPTSTYPQQMSPPPASPRTGSSRSNNSNGNNTKAASSSPSALSPPPVWQQLAVREACPRIHRHVQHVVRQTPFLSSPPSISVAPAKLCRHEIITGSVAGKGGFSVVTDVLRIQLDPNVSAKLSKEENEARRRVASQCTIEDGNDTTTGPRPRYVLKHLQEKLLMAPTKSKVIPSGPASAPGAGAAEDALSSSSSSSNPKNGGVRTSDFAAAAVDLILEGEYLRRLEHPNVVHLAGVPHRPGAQAYQYEGRYDGFFLLLEKIDLTLDDAVQIEGDEMVAAATSSSYPSLPFVVHDDNDHNNTASPYASRRTQFPRSLDDKLSVGIQLAQALAHLHSLDIVFRDLKPQNVGLVCSGDTSSCRVVLLDFGLCRQLPVDCGDGDDHHDQEARQEEQVAVNSSRRRKSIRGMYHMSAVGTRRYMAVEVVNTSRYNERADVFSWSLVLWEYLTLTRPFPNYDVPQHSLHVCQQGERPDTRNLPKEIQRLLQQCWTEDVDARLAMEEVVALLSAIVRSHYYVKVIACDHMDEEQDSRDHAAIGPIVGRTAEFALDKSDMAVSIPYSLQDVPLGSKSAHATTPFDDDSWELRAAHPVSPISWHLTQFEPATVRKLHSSATTRSLSSDDDSRYMKEAEQSPRGPIEERMVGFPRRRGGVLVTAAKRYDASASSTGSSRLSAISGSSHMFDDGDDEALWAGGSDDDHELSMSLVADPRAVATSQFDDAFW